MATYSFTSSFTIETRGKRGFRALAAQKAAEAARLELMETEWRVRSRVRAALATYRFAQRRHNALTEEAAAHAEVVRIFEKRLALGEAATPELSAARAEQTTLDANLQAAAAEVRQTLDAATQWLLPLVCRRPRSKGMRYLLRVSIQCPRPTRLL